MIKVTDLHKSFGKLLVLNGVTEHIKKGEARVHNRPQRQRQKHVPALP